MNVTGALSKRSQNIQKLVLSTHGQISFLFDADKQQGQVYMLFVQSMGAVHRWIRLNLETGPQVGTYAVQCELLSE